MTSLTQNRSFLFLLGAGSIAMVTILAVTYMGVIQVFLEYALNMFCLANKTTNNYLTIIPNH